MNYRKLIHEVVSPVTGKLIEEVRLAAKAEISEIITSLSKRERSPSAAEVLEFLQRLKEQILLHQKHLVEMTILETGFIYRDCEETISGIIDFLDGFEAYTRKRPSENIVISHSYSWHSCRKIIITHRPFNCIAAVVPQNASFPLSIVILASALYLGSKAVIRSSLQCAATGALLSEIVRKSRPPESSIEIINSLASDFLEACYESDNIGLIHYIGSNQYAEGVFTNSFKFGKVCLLDGQGNGILYMDDTFPVEEAIPLITSGATRFNGETCTSVNGVLVKDNIYDDVREALKESFENLRTGFPLDRDIQIGPLFSEKQATGLKRSLFNCRNARVICGGDVHDAYFTPILMEGVNMYDHIVQEGFFGPALWIAPVKEEGIFDWMRVNRFPLSDTILSNNNKMVRDFAMNSHAARICVNEDPSVESMFEPWGGYPPSGSNPVSVWTEKYRQTFQLDGRLDAILAVTSYND